LVVVSSDHGEHFGEEGIFYEHGPSVHDAALRIPLIVAGEGVSPHRDGGVARLEDVAPTLLAAAGLEGMAGLDGVDLSARMAGAAPSASLIALAESGGALHARFSLSLRSGRPERRLCLNDPPWSLCQRPDQPARLFNHQVDPMLRDDVAAQQPAVMKRLSEAAARWPVTARERTARSAGQKLTARPQASGGYQVEAISLRDRSVVAPSAELSAMLRALPPQEEGAAEVASEQEEALRALGYIE
ncbi:MAG: arylsulfatase A-like enzyme, partial [Myxococcota bacterium]